MTGATYDPIRVAGQRGCSFAPGATYGEELRQAVSFLEDIATWLRGHGYTEDVIQLAIVDGRGPAAARISEAPVVHRHARWAGQRQERELEDGHDHHDIPREGCPACRGRSR